MTLNFAEICRLCVMELPQQTFNIFTEYYTKRKVTPSSDILYCDMIAKCTKLKPSEDDGFPNHICYKCAKLLGITYKFNINCENAENKLKEYLKNNEDCKLEEKNDPELSTFNELLGEDSKNDLTGIEVKLEPVFDDESFWDADDEDLLLSDLKSRNDEIKSEQIESDSLSKLKKKKRGRPKKEASEAASEPSNSKLPHQCHLCGKVLSTKSNLKSHMICHTDQRPYTCELCPATFRCYSGLFQHRKVHTKETPYACPHCPKQFGRRTGLVNHVRIHTGDKDYTCDVCFKKFTQSAQLYVHLKRHRAERAFLCQLCGKGFPIQSDLKVHQRVHSGEKPYLCKLCPKTFATSGNLSIHVRIHNKEIRYTCKLCARGFVTRSSFNVHVKRHAGRRDHACDHAQCGKRFYTSSALKQHKVVHTGEKKYTCRFCEKRFTQTSHMNRHMKKDHPKEIKPKENNVLITNQPMTITNQPLTVSVEANMGGRVSNVKCEVVGMVDGGAMLEV